MSEFEAHSSTHRLEAFSDGVMAIAITLLTIEVVAPHVEEEETLDSIGALPLPLHGTMLASKE